MLVLSATLPLISLYIAPGRELEVDNHVLRKLDPITNLPMHLSLATAVTVSMGWLSNDNNVGSSVLKKSRLLRLSEQCKF